MRLMVSQVRAGTAQRKDPARNTGRGLNLRHMPGGSPVAMCNRSRELLLDELEGADEYPFIVVVAWRSATGADAAIDDQP